MLAINNVLQKVDGTCHTYCEDVRECVPARARICVAKLCPET